MKLNAKRVVLVGLAFFLITMFWQTYDTLVPKILTDKFGMSQTVSGAVMALDNVVALFLLPVFGVLSDRTKAKMGRRTVFILIGTLVSCVLFMGLTFADNMQLCQINEITPTTQVEDIEARDEAMNRLFDADIEIKTDAGVFDLKSLYTREAFLSIKMYEEDGKTLTKEYTKVVVPARQAYAWQKTIENPTPLILFVAALFLVLISMGTFRSPAVALMPDITPKPLRSKANAIINLMATLASAIILVLGIVFNTGTPENTFMSYTAFFAVVAGIMLICLAVFMATVRENEWVAETEKTNLELNLNDERAEALAKEHKRHLTKDEVKSFVFLLISVAFWFIGFNSVTSKYSVYANQVLGIDFNTTLLVSAAIATTAFIPIGILSAKIGRKKMILIGIGMLSGAFFVASFLGVGVSVWFINVLFAIAGIGWASINVNSFPMIVELATDSDVGRYTGLYYSASMAAQVLAPILSGLFLDGIGIEALFPFGCVSVAISFVTMLFVKHGDSKPQKSDKSLFEQLGDIDND